MASSSPLVAVFNNDPRVVNLIAGWLETRGTRVVRGSLIDFRNGHEDVAEFLRRYAPDVLLLDVGTPYGPNWDYVVALRLIPETSSVPSILTTTNKTALERAVGPTDAIELTATAEDLSALTHAIHRAAGQAVGEL